MALRFPHSSAVIAASHSVKLNNNADVSFKSNQTLKIPSSQRPPSSSSNLLLTSSVGSSPPPPPPPLLRQNDRHLLVLNSAACIVCTYSLLVLGDYPNFIHSKVDCFFVCLLQAAISASWLFISAIPTLLVMIITQFFVIHFSWLQISLLTHILNSDSID